MHTAGNVFWNPGGRKKGGITLGLNGGWYVIRKGYYRNVGTGYCCHFCAWCFTRNICGILLRGFNAAGSEYGEDDD